MNRLKRNAGWLLAVYVVLVLAAHQQASRSLIASLEQQLHTQLRPKLAGVELYSVASDQSKQYLATRVSQDLQHLCLNTVLNVLTACHARVLAFNNLAYKQAKPRYQLVQELESNRITIGLYYQTHWWRLLFGQLLLLLPLVLFIGYCPFVLNKREREWARRFNACGLGKQQTNAAVAALAGLNTPLLAKLEFWLQQHLLPAAALIELLECRRLNTLNDDQLVWFEQALHQRKSVNEALLVALSPSHLSFVPSQRTVVVHGLAIELPGTPFFYYYWYALRRVSNCQEGWVINPATHKPVNSIANSTCSSELCALIELHGGHARASKDLQEKGLRAKTLDQNRSKVKEELSQVLGEALSQDYLFDTQRDAKTARYKYRLSLAPHQIELPQEDLALISQGPVKQAHSAA